MITMAFIAALGKIILLHALFSADTLARMAGQYRKYFEVFIVVIYPIPFLATGTITGALVAMLSGVFLSCYMEFRKITFGAQYKVNGGKWLTTDGIIGSGGFAPMLKKFWYGEEK